MSCQLSLNESKRKELTTLFETKGNKRLTISKCTNSSKNLKTVNIADLVSPYSKNEKNKKLQIIRCCIPCYKNELKFKSKLHQQPHLTEEFRNIIMKDNQYKKLSNNINDETQPEINNEHQPELIQQDKDEIIEELKEEIQTLKKIDHQRIENEKTLIELAQKKQSKLNYNYIVTS